MLKLPLLVMLIASCEGLGSIGMHSPFCRDIPHQYYCFSEKIAQFCGALRDCAKNWAEGQQIPEGYANFGDIYLARHGSNFTAPILPIRNPQPDKYKKIYRDNPPTEEEMTEYTDLKAALTKNREQQAALLEEIRGLSTTSK